MDVAPWHDGLIHILLDGRAFDLTPDDLLDEDCEEQLMSLLTGADDAGTSRPADAGASPGTVSETLPEDQRCITRFWE